MKNYLANDYTGYVMENLVMHYYNHWIGDCTKDIDLSQVTKITKDGHCGDTELHEGWNAVYVTFKGNDLTGGDFIFGNCSAFLRLNRDWYMTPAFEAYRNRIGIAKREWREYDKDYNDLDLRGECYNFGFQA